MLACAISLLRVRTICVEIEAIVFIVAVTKGYFNVVRGDHETVEVLDVIQGVVVARDDDVHLNFGEVAQLALVDVV